MNETLTTTAQKINLLNETTSRSLLEGSGLLIIKNFTEASIKILEADFGFAWCRFSENDSYKIMYKSPNTPYQPSIPTRKKNKKQTHRTLFDSDVQKGEYECGLERYLKSYIIIPINYGDHVYGSLVMCYKKKHIFTEEELSLSRAIGNAIAQTITINWLVVNEKKALILAEKQKETEILLAQEKLKIEFIANATHELRTPLAIIKGNVDLAMMRSRKALKTSDNYLNDINSEIKHLSNILSDLNLITSKGKELKNKISYDKVDIGSLIKAVVERSKTLAYKKNISITAKLIPGLIILGDKVYLEKMLLNLIKNSITYGNKNGYTKITTKKSKGFITINIADNGVGICKEDMPYIFDRFYRADKSHSSNGNSTGLGLSIVKWVVEAHGGIVSVKNNKTKGSVFCVCLPIKTVSN